MVTSMSPAWYFFDVTRERNRQTKHRPIVEIEGSRQRLSPSMFAGQIASVHRFRLQCDPRHTRWREVCLSILLWFHEIGKEASYGRRDHPDSEH
jgi:hypothetical protein